MKYGMVIDLEKCIGCRSCMIACKIHNRQPPANWWNRVFTPGSLTHLIPPEEGVQYFLPLSCQHCENAPCEKVCPVGATYTDENGAVLVDYDRCIGCRYCMAACPYGVRQFNWQDYEKALKDYNLMDNFEYGYRKIFKKKGRLVYMLKRYKGVVEKCTFCIQYIEKGIEPACVRACPGKARFFGDLDDENSNVSKLIKNNAFNILPDKGTRPKVYYLPPINKLRQFYD